MITVSKLGQALTGVVEQLTQVSQAAQQTATDLQQAADAARSGVENAAEAIDATATRLASTATRLEGDLRGSVERTRELIRELEDDHATRVDDLRDRLEAAANDWNAVLETALDRLEDGSLRFEEFLADFGDWQVGVGEASESVAELLGALDPREFRERAQAIQLALRQGLLDVQAIVGELSKLQNRYAQELVRVLKLFQEGRATLEAVLRAAREAREALGEDGITGILAEGLEELLRQGQLSGEL